MKNSCSSVSFRCSTVCMLFVFVLVAFISFAGTATAVYAGIFTVTSTSDDVSNPDSLRYAIQNATSQDVINFDLEYPAIITLDEQLSIDHGLTIQGPGADLLAVSGGGECRVFYIEDTAESVDISGISIVSGDADNDFYSWGGGIRNKSDCLIVGNCCFSGNHAEIGGGMDNHYSSSTVTNCTFSSNSAVLGGGMYNCESSPTVTNCTFTSNIATGGGGMCNVSESSPKVSNCTFTSNSADDGGGMINEESSPTVANCIFWDTSGGEIYNNYVDSSYLPILGFCIVQSNDVGEGTIANDIISADPELEELADNGGPTWTCALPDGSSAIDAGMTISDISTDQRRAPRPYNGGSFDIGAYESGTGFYTITSICSGGGTISPTEAHSLGNGTEDEVFYLMSDEGYEVEAVYVDDVSDSYDEASNTYIFENVSANHVISVDFKPSVNGTSGGGCNVGAFMPLSLLLLTPLAFMFRK